MRTSSIVAGLVAGVAGLAGAVAGYQQLAASPRHSETVQVTDTSATPPPRAATPRPATRVRLRDCPRGFDLRKGTCVREVERTVVIDVAQPAAAPAPATAALRSSDAPATHDVGDDHVGQGGQGGRGDEAGDDHGGRGDDGRDEADHADDSGEDHHGDAAGEGSEDGHHDGAEDEDHSGEVEPHDD